MRWERDGVRLGLGFNGHGSPEPEQVVERLRASGLRSELVAGEAHVYVSSPTDCARVGSVLMQFVVEADYALKLEMISPDSVDTIHIFYPELGEEQISVPIALATDLHDVGDR